MNYPTEKELLAMGARLQKDVCLWTPRLEREYKTVQYMQPNVPLTLTREVDPPHVFGSSYVGVSVYKERWFISNWTVDKRAKRGHLRPRTEQGERWAAQDRARALGLEYLERRDGKRIPYKLWEPEEV